MEELITTDERNRTRIFTGETDSHGYLSGKEQSKRYLPLRRTRTQRRDILCKEEQERKGEIIIQCEKIGHGFSQLRRIHTDINWQRAEQKIFTAKKNKNAKERYFMQRRTRTQRRDYYTM